MKALTWKEVFASMNPSPVFEALAIFAEDLAIKGDESYEQEITELPYRPQSRNARRSGGSKHDPTPQNFVKWIFTPSSLRA
jgi:hypothetical protein